MVLLLIHIFSGLFLSQLPVQDDTSFQFSRDYLRLAYENWIEANEAELIRLNDRNSDEYGLSVSGTYQTKNGEKNIIFYLNSDEEIYDVGMQFPYLDEFDADNFTARFISRVLWASTLTDAQLLAKLWFTESREIELRYDDRIGSGNELLTIFIDDIQKSNKDLWLTQIQEINKTVILNFEVDGNLLEISVNPSLNIFLNGQTEVGIQSVAAWMNGEFVPSDLNETHEFHQLKKNENKFSINTITREGHQAVVEFEKNEDDWVPGSGSLQEGTGNSQYQEIIYGYWLTRNIPEVNQTNYRLTLDSLSVSLKIDGYDKPANTIDEKMVMNSIGWLGSGKISYVEVSNLEETNDKISSITYVLYYDPDLKYQNILRIKDQFKINEFSLIWKESDITILPLVRLDHIGDLYLEDEMPDYGFKRFFED